jgi:hypothetical protein
VYDFTSYHANFWDHFFREFLELLTNKISAGKLENKEKASSFVVSAFLCTTIRLHSYYLIINKTDP